MPASTLPTPKPTPAPRATPNTNADRTLMSLSDASELHHSNPDRDYHLHRAGVYALLAIADAITTTK